MDFYIFLITLIWLHPKRYDVNEWHRENLVVNDLDVIIVLLNYICPERYALAAQLCWWSLFKFTEKRSKDENKATSKKRRKLTSTTSCVAAHINLE